MNRFTTVSLAAVAALSLAAPALAQDKPKKPSADNGSQGIEILADAREFCDRVAGNDSSVLDALEDAGWNPEVDAYGEVPYYHEIEGTRDYPGAGKAEIWGFVELYPTHIIGYCTFEIVDPSFDIPVEELTSMPGLTGETETIDYGTYTTLSNSTPPHHLFIQARQTEDSFVYQVTDIIPED